MNKIAVFGCKSTTIFLLESLRKTIDISCVITISPEDGEKNQVADYADLTKYSNEQNINCYTAQRYDLKNEEDKKYLAALKLNIAFVVGWQRLIPKDILNSFSMGVYGMHGSPDNLPFGRGRSPMNWALIEQRKHFHTNIFRYDPGVDSGDILDTFIFSIRADDTSETLHYKNVMAMRNLVLKNIDDLGSGKVILKKQRANKPTYYPKRSPSDSLINWEQDIFRLDAFIRAVTRPFNGAFSYLDDKKIIIWRASIFETDIVDYGYEDVRSGTIVEIFPGGKFILKCRSGLLIVHEYETESLINNGSELESPADQLTHFKLNESGYHDLEHT